MVCQGENYCICKKNDVELMQVAYYLAPNPYGIVYVENAGQIVGTITIGDVVRGIKKGEFTYNSSFTWATTHTEACAYINTKPSFHAVPVLNKHKLLVEHYQEDYVVPERFINGILYKLKNYTGLYAMEVLKQLQIKEIRILQTLDSDTELCSLIENVLQNSGIPITQATYSSFLEDRENGVDRNIMWIDAGENYFAQKIRRYIWAQSENQGHLCSFFSYIKDFLNLVNNASVSYNGYDRYFEDILEKYKNVAVYGHNPFVSKIVKSNPKLHDITNEVQVRWNSAMEWYELEGPEAEYGCIVIMDCLQSANVPFYYNNSYIASDLYYFDCEYYVTKQYCQTIFPLLERNNVRTFFIQLKDMQSVLKAASVNVISEFNGNDRRCNPLSGQGCENEYKVFLGYDKEITEGFLGMSNPYMKTLVPGDLYYSMERNPVAKKLEGHKNVHIFGCCMISGPYVIDEDTMAAVVKREHPEWNVYSHASISVDLLETIQYYSDFYSGDIVILMSTLYSSIDEKLLEGYRDRIIDFSNVYHVFPDIYRRIWQTPYHCNHTVIEKIIQFVMQQIEKESKKIFSDFLAEENAERIDVPKGNASITLKKANGGLKEYIAVLEKEADGTTDNGAIVMNCNPFTKGHRYLIEVASVQVERLFVFVVEEDKSFFSFQDRFEMVKRGCADLDNVTVLPSGRYVLSALTLPGYFEKDDLQNTVLDASADLELFAYQIAPVLHIKKRFVGTEPADHFTAQYNQEMKRILPKAGIELVEIERIKERQQVVSASLVRKALQEKRVKDIEALVPKSTFDYLMKNSNFV